MAISLKPYIFKKKVFVKYKRRYFRIRAYKKRDSDKYYTRPERNGKIRCSICKYFLDPEEFDNDKNHKSGKSSYCKVCRKSHYDNKRNVKSNTGIIGLFRYQCPVCKEWFNTRKSNKEFCSRKCNKRDWYERNEQTPTGKKYGRSKSHLNIKKNKDK